MTLTSKDGSGPVFRDGKLRPGIYKIQNIVGQTYVDIREHAKELCGRPATLLEGKGLVRSCPHLTQKAVVTVIFSGKYFLPVLDIPFAGCSVKPSFSLPHTERGDVARTRQTQAILHHARWVGKRKYCIRCRFSRALENGDRSRRPLS
jgi:hypothetical protein